MNLIFDFDGTICDSFELTLKIANEFLAKFNKKPINALEFKTKGIEEIIKDYKLTKIQILIYIFKGRRELSKHISELSSFSNMTDVIKKLSKENTLAIVSSNSEKNIHTFLKLNKLDTYFKFIVSSPTLFNKAKKIESAIKKYNLMKNETIYIGDEVRDIKAAKKTGVKSAAVTWGFASKILLNKFNPDFLIDDPQKLLSLEKKSKH